MAELEAEITQTLNSTTFLVERLEDWQGNNLTDETARDWGGHVVPALARLRDYLAERDNEEAELLTIAAMHGQKQGDDRVRELEARVAELTEALRTAKEGLEDAQKYMTRGGIAPVFTERLRAVNAALAGKEEG